jgi:hypothetical protein
LQSLDFSKSGARLYSLHSRAFLNYLHTILQYFWHSKYQQCLPTRFSTLQPEHSTRHATAALQPFPSQYPLLASLYQYISATVVSVAMLLVHSSPRALLFLSQPSTCQALQHIRVQNPLRVGFVRLAVLTSWRALRSVT